MRDGEAVLSQAPGGCLAVLFIAPCGGGMRTGPGRSAICCNEAPPPSEQHDAKGFVVAPASTARRLPPFLLLSSAGRSGEAGCPWRCRLIAETRGTCGSRSLRPLVDPVEPRLER